MWEGQAVELVVTSAGPHAIPAEGGQLESVPKKLPGPPPGWKPGAPSKVAGLLANEWTEEDDKILERIQADRKAAKWREIPE